MIKYLLFLTLFIGCTTVQIYCPKHDNKEDTSCISDTGIRLRRSWSTSYPDTIPVPGGNGYMWHTSKGGDYDLMPLYNIWLH